jgi:hypothetical protein
MFPDELDDSVEDFGLEKKPEEKKEEKAPSKEEPVSIEIGKLESKLTEGQELFYRAKSIGTGFLFEPLIMQQVKEFEAEKEWLEKQKNPFRLIIPACTVLNILAVLSFTFLGNPIPFVLLLAVNALLVLVFFLAGENFWLWLYYWFQRTKNWGFKFLSSLAGQDELHFGKLEEVHNFKYKDEAGIKRVSPVRTRKIRYFSNLRAGYAIYREGIPDSLDLHEEYPTARLNRDTNQSILGGVQSGYLLAMDELVALWKKKGQDMMMMLFLGLIVILLIVSIYISYKNPETIAKAISSVINSTTTGSGGVINVPPTG